MKLTHSLTHFSLIIFFILNCSSLFSQNLFDLDRKEIKEPKSEKLKKWKDNVGKSKLTKSKWFISINDVKLIQKDGKFKIKIPDDNIQYSTLSKYVKFYNDDNYNYYGIIQDVKNRNVGNITLAKVKGIFYSEFNINDRSFVIDDLGQNIEEKENSNIQFLIEKDVIELNTHKCGVIDDFKGINELQDGSNSRNDKVVESRSLICPVRVSILVLYTPSAAQAVGNIDAKTSLMMDELNTAMSNTSIPATSTRFTLAGNLIYNGTLINDQTMNNFNIVNLLSSGQDSYVNELRNIYNADLVSIITNCPTNVRNGNYGAANQPFYLPYANNLAFSAVHYDHTGRFTFSHEIGHNFGCRHDNDPDDTNYTTSDPRWAARGKVVQNCGVSTIMVELTDFTTKPDRILYFSNPALFTPNCGGDTGSDPLQDKRLGTLNSRDNSKMFVNYQQKTVSDYYPTDAPHVSITGNNFIYDNFTYTWCPVISCGFGTNITYQWSWSLDGFTNYNSIANSECIELTPSYFGVSNVNITLKLVANNGFGSYMDFFTVFVAPNIYARPLNDLPKDFVKLDNKVNNKYNFYPNPSTSEAFIGLNLMAESIISIDVYNNLGQWEQSILNRQPFVKGSHTVNIDLRNEAKGYKIILINDEIKTHALPVIVK